MMLVRIWTLVMPLLIAACEYFHSRLVEQWLTYRRFCQQDEEHDPGDEFEEYLACSVCGDNGECTSRKTHICQRVQL